MVMDIDPNGRDIDGNLMENAFADLASDSQFLAQGWEMDLDEVSQVSASAGDSFFVLQPVDEKPARERSLDEVRSRLVADWTKIQALASAKAEADSGLQNTQNTLADIAPSSAFTRTGTGLDNEAASLIADAAFAQNKDEATLVETGDSVILVRTDEVIAADTESRNSLQTQIADTLDNLVQADLSSALVITLSEKHALEINTASVQQLLIGQTSR
jgi:peptidyl-prolyl cis-trans isomerase D